MTDRQISKKILMTGASGFIGSHLLPKLLEQGKQVLCLQRSKMDLTHANLKVETKIHSTKDLIQTAKDFEPDLVIHLATHFVGEHQTEDLEKLTDANLLFGMRVAEAVSHTDCRKFLNVGTTWQNFGGSSYSPFSLYAATKQAFSDLLQYYAEVREFQVLNLKLSDTYGPNDPRKKLVSVFFEAAETGNPVSLSGGDQLVDLVHIEDVLRAFFKAIECLDQKEKNESGLESYSVCSAEMVSLKRFAEIFCEATGQKLECEWGARPYRARERFTPEIYDPPLPGWEPKVSLSAGLRKMGSGNGRP